MATSSNSARSSYIPSLDGIRALSIMIVFFGHAGVSSNIPGGFGVTIFFFLSGFLISSLLINEIESYDRIAFVAFYKRRVIRLGPPLLVTILAGLILASVGLVSGDMHPGVILSQIFFYFNYYNLYGPTESSVTGFEILWSLAVEEHFYLIWPLVFLALARSWLSIRHLIIILAAILLWRCLRVFWIGDGEWVIYTSTDTRIDNLLFGCLLAMLVWKGHVDTILRAGVIHYVVIAVAMLVLVATFLIRDDVFRSTLRYSLQGLALLPLFYYATKFPDFFLYRPLNWMPIRRIGHWSYTIYLSHFVIIHAMRENGMEAWGTGVFTLLAGILAIAWAAMVYQVIERPLHKVRAGLSGH